MKRGKGRPKLDEEKLRDSSLLIRLTAQEKLTLTEKAKSFGKTLSRWARERLLLGEDK